MIKDDSTINETITVNAKELLDKQRKEWEEIKMQNLKHKIATFGLIVASDYLQGKITEKQFDTIMWELNSDNSLEYKYGIYTMYLIMMMGRVN